MKILMLAILMPAQKGRTQKERLSRRLQAVAFYMEKIYRENDSKILKASRAGLCTEKENRI
jgi:hypothetical protein